MRQIEIYSTQLCPFCVRAKALLDSIDHKILQRMMKRSGQRTVPQIFIDGISVGGFEQLSQLAAAGELG